MNKINFDEIKPGVWYPVNKVCLKSIEESCTQCYNGFKILYNKRNNVENYKNVIINPLTDFYIGFVYNSKLETLCDTIEMDKGYIMLVPSEVYTTK